MNKGELKRNRELISIIVPVYNVEEYLEECIESLCKQSYTDIEIILIDDGSTDSSGRICDAFREKDHRILVLHQENKGLSGARNSGMRMANGKYIGFIDGDDWIETDMFEFLYDSIISKNAEMSCCALDLVRKGKHYRWRDYKKVKDTIKGNEFLELMNYGQAGESVCICLWKKSLIQSAEFYNGISIGEDYDFKMQTLWGVERIAVEDQVKYHYRQNPTSLCNRGFTDKSSRNLKHYYEQYLKYSKAYPESEEAIFCYYYLQLLSSAISMVKSGNYNMETLKFIKRQTRELFMKYIIIGNVSIIMKICAMLFCINENLLIIPYRIFIHPFRKA